MVEAYSIYWDSITFNSETLFRYLYYGQICLHHWWRSGLPQIRERAFQAALDYLQQDSKVYENATDVQREALVRQLRKQFGIKEKRAPSVARIFGKLKDIRKVIMTERVALNKQLKDQIRGGKYAVKTVKEATQALIKD